jgi:decaprenyl-phosphate phosphoribosyltransferase
MPSLAGRVRHRGELHSELVAAGERPLNNARVEDGGSAVADGQSAAPRRGTIRALFALARPRQWTKNVLVVAAAGAAGALGHPGVPLRVGLACIAFCMLASGVYAINDVRDAPEDRLHPHKRLRPVAAGEVRPRAAIAFGIGAMAAGLITCALVRPALALVGGGYLALTMTYALVWRYVAVLDVLAIAGGFVLRAVAGAVAAPVGLSRWFILVVTFAAVFVAAGKRYAELLRRGAPGDQRRATLAHYSPRELRTILVGSAVAALVAYAAWALELPSVNGVPWRALTILPFAACLARYGSLLAAGEGEAPEETVLTDRWLLLSGVAWVVLFALGVHAAS